MQPTAAAGAAAPATGGTTDFQWPADCEKHYKLLSYQGSPGTKYMVPAMQELHPQVFLTPPWTGDVQAVAFKPIVDNPKVLHHWIMYAPDGSFITGWAPGNDGSHLPDDVGMYLPSSGQLRMDMHYNNLTGTTDEQDASGVEVCVIETPSKFRKNTAAVVGIAGNANAPAHQHVDNVSTCTVQGNATLVSESPHMHLLGVHAKLVFIHSGMQQVLHDGDFSFDNQKSYPLDPRVVVTSGDQFQITCSYTNDTDQNVTFGENTGNEMCFNFVAAYPKNGFTCSGGFGGFGLPGGS